MNLISDMNFVSSIADHAFDAALALVYPQACAVCGRSVESRHDGVACARCWNEAPLFRGDETLCWKCGALSLAKVSYDRRETIRCGRCETDEFTAARACGLYEGALRASILELKRQPHVARRVAHVMYDVQQREPLNQADV
ncbi:MAG TPA: double zinc ribbon domain-containing protein, partial [Pyrinomonadaceae bacterium]|nr:double zinc ribbon domain-containing protein [Pyrinomonadaceae bacterium]